MEFTVYMYSQAEQEGEKERGGQFVCVCVCVCGAENTSITGVATSWDGYAIMPFTFHSFQGRMVKSFLVSCGHHMHTSTTTQFYHVQGCIAVDG